MQRGGGERQSISIEGSGKEKTPHAWTGMELRSSALGMACHSQRSEKLQRAGFSPELQTHSQLYT